LKGRGIAQSLDELREILHVTVRAICRSGPAPFVRQDRQRRVLANLLIGNIDQLLLVHVPYLLHRVELLA
jgi:hypothetical protein